MEVSRVQSKSKSARNSPSSHVPKDSCKMIERIEDEHYVDGRRTSSADARRKQNDEIV
jgi:hypothetical protein